jgi:hypothetical protein
MPTWPCSVLDKPKMSNQTDSRALPCDKAPAVIGLNWTKWAGILTEYGTVQIVVQVISGFASLGLIRLLSKDEYALFGLWAAMQATCTLLGDIGISIGIRAEGGKIWRDRERFGTLINTAMSIRSRFSAVSLVVCMPILIVALSRNGASAGELVSLSILLAVSVWLQFRSSVLIVAPQFFGAHRRLQRLDLIASLIRVGVIGLCVVLPGKAILAACAMVAVNYWQSARLSSWFADYGDPAAAASRFFPGKVAGGVQTVSGKHDILLPAGADRTPCVGACGKRRSRCGYKCAWSAIDVICGVHSDVYKYCDPTVRHLSGIQTIRSAIYVDNWDCPIGASDNSGSRQYYPSGIHMAARPTVRWHVQRVRVGNGGSLFDAVCDGFMGSKLLAGMAVPTVEGVHSNSSLCTSSSALVP